MQPVVTMSCHGGVTGVNCNLDAQTPACGSGGGLSCYVYYAATCTKPNVARVNAPIDQLANLDLSPLRALLQPKPGPATVCSSPAEFDVWLQRYLSANKRQTQASMNSDILEPKRYNAGKGGL